MRGRTTARQCKGFDSYYSTFFFKLHRPPANLTWLAVLRFNPLFFNSTMLSPGISLLFSPTQPPFEVIIAPLGVFNVHVILCCFAVLLIIPLAHLAIYRSKFRPHTAPNCPAVKVSSAHASHITGSAKISELAASHSLPRLRNAVLSCAYHCTSVSGAEHEVALIMQNIWITLSF